MCDKTMSEIAIIGAGITGAYTAYLLASSGQEVIIFDAESLSYRATSCNPGGINPLHGPGTPGVMSDFYLSCYSDHLLHKDRVQELSGTDFRFRIIDRLFLAFSEEEEQALLKMQETYNSQQGFSAKWYTQERLRGLDARISDKAVGGLLTRGNIVIDSELYCEALKSAAIKLGARCVKKNVEDLVTQGQRVTHVVSEGEQFACSAAVLATGYWTDSLSKKLGVHVSVAPVKGELLLIKVNEEPFEFDITRGLAGLYQYKDDLYWLGGTTDDPALCPDVSAEGKAEILDKIGVMLPELNQYSIVTHSTGYRPMSADKLPVVGRLPGYENIYVGTGGGSKGILVCSGIARELVGLIEGSSSHKFGFLTPDRFHVTG